MSKFKKFFLISTLFIFVLLGLTSCKLFKKPTEEPEKAPSVTCDIKFAKTVNDKYEATEWYEDNSFEINTKIYVIVDFTFINYGSEDDLIEFKIQIPNAKYYSTYDYVKGSIIPTIDEKPVYNSDGTINMTIIELGDMFFYIKKGEIPFKYTYCFVIEANMECEFAEFKAVFISENGMVMDRNQTFVKTYSFYSKEGNQE